MTDIHLAADGKPFDIDNLPGQPLPDEVEVIQYLRPYGQRRHMRAVIPASLALKTKMAGLVITAENIGNLVHLTVRHPDAPEETEVAGLAANGPGPTSPSNVLVGLIEKCLAARTDETRWVPKPDNQKEPTDV